MGKRWQQQKVVEKRQKWKTLRDYNYTTTVLHKCLVSRLWCRPIGRKWDLWLDKTYVQRHQVAMHRIATFSGCVLFYFIVLPRSWNPNSCRRSASAYRLDRLFLHAGKHALYRCCSRQWLQFIRSSPELFTASSSSSSSRWVFDTIVIDRELLKYTAPVDSHSHILAPIILSLLFFSSIDAHMQHCSECNGWLVVCFVAAAANC